MNPKLRGRIMYVENDVWCRKGRNFKFYKLAVYNVIICRWNWDVSKLWYLRKGTLKHKFGSHSRDNFSPLAQTNLNLKFTFMLIDFVSATYIKWAQEACLPASHFFPVLASYDYLICQIPDDDEGFQLFLWHENSQMICHLFIRFLTFPS